MTEFDDKSAATHWHVQWARRDAFLADWAEHRRTVIRGTDVPMEQTQRRTKRGMYMGWEGGNPTRLLDAARNEVPARTTTTIHRHSWDALMVPICGSGWTEIDGVRIEWTAWDGIHLPAFAWHKHGNDGDSEIAFMTFSSYPLMRSLNLATIEEGGDTDFSSLPAPAMAPSRLNGTDPNALRINDLATLADLRSQASVHVDYDEHPLRTNPKGSRSKFLHDESLGMMTSGLTSVMLQLAPGYQQSMHRHPGEAWLYVIEGRGHSYLGEGPEGGQIFEWSAGDLIVVDHFLWHQHFNDVADGSSRLIRVHMFASILETMRATMFPMPLFEELLETAPDVGAVVWPPDERPKETD